MNRSIDLVNPADGILIERIVADDDQAVDRKLQAAADAQRAWRRSPLDVRAAAARRLGAILRDEVEEHARRITIEMGKPLAESRAEVLKCATTCDFYADHVAAYLEPTAVTTQHARSFVQYAPIGVVFAVMPWNFPYWQVIRFVVPALLAGNGGLLKHAANVTGSAIAIADAVRRAGFPDGLFDALLLPGHDAVATVIADPRIAAVTLTGSERAGATVAAAAGRALKKTVLELGGSDPFVVLADADLDTVVPLAVRARFVNAGQSCLCAKRFIVEAPIAAEFERRVVAEVARLRVGDPLLEGTTVGPLAKPGFVDDIDDQVRRSIAAGARLVAGGARRDGPGSFYEPTVLADVTRTMAVFREETFGPVLPIVVARDADEAVDLANDSPYGLAASVWTADADRGLALGERIDSGALFVNDVVVSDPRLPFGGVKLSGYGRELSREGMLEFMNVRAVVAEPAPGA